MNANISGGRESERDELEARWLDLTRRALPAVAVGRGWPVGFDHCFARILLDNACGGVWYDHVARRPAYRHINVATLAAAVALGEAALAGDADLSDLNTHSLDWRRARRGEAGR